MPWYIVTCRLEWDDEDSVNVYEAADADAALVLAEAEMRDDSASGDADVAADDTRRAFYWNEVIECDTPPRIVRTNH